MDGKQALATNNCTTLGMLFDHGCDSVTIYLSVSLQINVMRLCFDNNSLMGILLLLSFFIPQFLQFVEVYFFRRLDLPTINYSGEGLVIICGECLLTAIYGLFI